MFSCVSSFTLKRHRSERSILSSLVEVMGIRLPTIYDGPALPLVVVQSPVAGMQDECGDAARTHVHVQDLEA